jgi:hypothetical protein
MKFHQKVIILMVVFVLALASMGMIAAAPVTQSQVVAESISAPAQAQGATAFLFIPGGPGIVVPNVSWNS